MISRERAVAHVRESLTIHREWVEHLTGPDACEHCLARVDDSSGAGGVAHHQRCVKKYEELLEFVEAA